MGIEVKSTSKKVSLMKDLSKTKDVSMLEKHSNHSSDMIKLIVAKNENTPDNVLMKIAENNLSYPFLYAVVTNVNASSETIDYVIGHGGIEANVLYENRKTPLFIELNIERSASREPSNIISKLIVDKSSPTSEKVLDRIFNFALDLEPEKSNKIVEFICSREDLSLDFHLKLADYLSGSGDYISAWHYFRTNEDRIDGRVLDVLVNSSDPEILIHIMNYTNSSEYISLAFSKILAKAFDTEEEYGVANLMRSAEYILGNLASPLDLAVRSYALLKHNAPVSDVSKGGRYRFRRNEKDFETLISHNDNAKKFLEERGVNVKDLSQDFLNQLFLLRATEEGLFDLSYFPERALRVGA